MSLKIESKKGLGVLIVGFIFMIAINIMFYVTLGQDVALIEGDLFDQMLASEQEGYLQDDLKQNIPTNQESTSENLGYFDPFTKIVGFLKLLVNVVFLPIGLFVSQTLPSTVVFMIGAPLSLIYAIGLVFFIRGLS